MAGASLGAWPLLLKVILNKKEINKVKVYFIRVKLYTKDIKKVLDCNYLPTIILNHLLYLTQLTTRWLLLQRHFYAGKKEYKERKQKGDFGRLKVDRKDQPVRYEPKNKTENKNIRSKN
jgi:hypothetical protein